MNAEKQLVQWLGEIGVDVNSQNTVPPLQMSHAHPHSIQTDVLMLKEERHDPADIKNIDISQHEYVPAIYSSYNQPMTRLKNKKIENEQSTTSLNNESTSVAPVSTFVNFQSQFNKIN